MSLLTIVISTMNEGILGCINVTKIIHPEIKYLIIHQNHNSTIIPTILIREDIKIINTKSKGLSNSRNIGLKNCKSKYALIADDDITYNEENLISILDLLRKEESDIYLFKIKTNEGEPEYKEYPESFYSVNTGAKHWFSSVEILIDVDSINSNQIKFDNRFGLGTILRRGEEEILINDCIRKKLRTNFYPIYLPNHPFESSGKRNESDTFFHFFRGALSNRLNGKYSLKFSKNEAKLTNKNYLAYKCGKLYIKVTNFFRVI